MQEIINRAKELVENGIVDRVLGWKRGEFDYETTPAVFSAETGFDALVYDSFCVGNLAKYLINEMKKPGRIAVLTKPCDSYGLNQLVKEHRIDRERIYVVAIPCRCKVNPDKVRAKGIKGITSIEEDGETLTVHTLYGDKQIARNEVLHDKCMVCMKEHVIKDEECGEAVAPTFQKLDRMEQVKALEALTPQERFDYWRSQLSKCIRCNACRNVCPVCNCHKCVFDNENSGVASKAPADDFEENMFHIIRAFHVAGRCTDCGECSRVCPQNIPLHLLNRKFILEINELYGEYQAGMDAETRGPLTAYTEGDCEPSVVYHK